MLIVSNTYPPADISGVASLVYELAHRLGAGGANHVRVLTREVAVADEYAVGVGGGKGLYPWRAGRRFLKLAKQERYDLIHVHESDGFFVALFFALGRFLRRPWAKGKLVATLQVSYDEERRKIRPVEANGEVVSKPTGDEKSFARFRARVHAGFGRWTVRFADRVVAPSRVTAGELKADYGARDVEVIYNGIAIDDQVKGAAEALDRRRQENPASEIILYAGRMRTRKAVAVLLHAFKKVLAARPNAELVLIGHGEQVDALQEYQRQLELGESTRFLGQIPRDKIFDAFAGADVYCLPSLYEGFPVATLEAMAVGLPVVSTTVSGIPEQVEHGVHGLLVEPEDSDALAVALIELLESPEKRLQMGLAGRKRVHEEFTIDTIAEDYQKLWQNLVAEDSR